jgi:protein Xni
VEICFLLVDALNLIRRVYAAQPGEDGPQRVEGAREACARSLQRALREARPTHAVCVFEGEGASWRHELFPEYKAGRAPMPSALKEGLSSFQEAFRIHGVFSLSFPGLEADDVVATLACKVSERGGRVRVLSTDKMFLQLISERVSVRDHFAQQDLDEEYVRKKFGVGPDRIVDFLALSGDATNHIPGVPGVGPKRAAALLQEFGSLEAVLSGAARVKGSLGGTLGSHGDAARLARSLVRLRTDLELGVNLKSFRFVGTGSA